MAGNVSISVAQQQQAFNERLRRIEKGGRYTSQHVYCGPEEEVASLQAGGKRVKYSYGSSRSLMGGFLGGVIGRLIAAPMSIVLGILAVVAARVLRVSFFGGGLAGENAAQMFAYDMGIAVALVLILRRLFRFNGNFQWLTVFAMAVALFGMHNFVHSNPAVFATLFTQEWVQGVVNTTREGTLLIAGKTVTF
jgi:hypothetical protein